MPRFGRDKDSSRKEELDRQAAEEVERLTRRGGPPGMGGGMPMGGAPVGPPSPLEQMAAEVQDAPRPSQRRQQPRKAAAPKPQQAFTPMPSGQVGSSFGPGGLNPGPRMGGAAPPPPAFGGGAYDEDYEGSVSGPPVYNAEPDEDEEMTITEMALMDHAARTGHRPEDLVMQYDASNAEDMRDEAMRKFYERQQARRPGASTNNPFAPAGMRGGGAGASPIRRNEDPAAAGGALAQRLANRRRREEEEARRARSPAAEAASGPGVGNDGPATDDAALARVLARRRRSLGVDAPAAVAEAEADPEETAVPGRRHAGARQKSAPRLRSVPAPAMDDESVPSRPTAARQTKKAAAPAKRAAKATVKKKPAKAAATTAPATRKAAKAPAAKAPTAKVAKAPKTKKAGASLAKAGSAKAPALKAPAARQVGKAKTVFCIECGEKNPAIAKFCFNCGTRLAAPEN